MRSFDPEQLIAALAIAAAIAVVLALRHLFQF
jgi:hypothetical protein